jgi:hypothetical protein
MSLTLMVQPDDMVMLTFMFAVDVPAKAAEGATNTAARSARPKLET